MSKVPGIKCLYSVNSFSPAFLLLPESKDNLSSYMEHQYITNTEYVKLQSKSIMEKAGLFLRMPYEIIHIFWNQAYIMYRLYSIINVETIQAAMQICTWSNPMDTPFQTSMVGDVTSNITIFWGLYPLIHKEKLKEKSTMAPALSMHNPFSRARHNSQR